MSENNPIRVFVTHAFQETDDYLRVFEFLESMDRFFYLNVSKPDNVPTTGGIDAIKDELIQQIKQAEAVIVLPGLYEEKQSMARFLMDPAASTKGSSARSWGVNGSASASRFTNTKPPQTSARNCGRPCSLLSNPSACSMPGAPINRPSSSNDQRW